MPKCSFGVGAYRMASPAVLWLLLYVAHADSDGSFQRALIEDLVTRRFVVSAYPD